MRVLVTGSHGPVGQAVRHALPPRRQITALSRRPAPGELRWLPEAHGAIDEPERLEGHDAAVHLAAAPEPTWRWTDAWREQATQRATASTTMLAEALAALRRPPPVLIVMSDTAWYGDRGDAVLDETCGPGDGFLARVAQQLEAAAQPAADAGIRVVPLRAGLVVGRGFLGRLAALSARGVGRRVGPGSQWWSWVTLADLGAMVVHCIEDVAVAGPVNAVAPEPVTADELVAAMARVRRGRMRPVVPLPRPVLRAALGHEMAAETALASRRVTPAVLLRRGYEWRVPALPLALAGSRPQ